MSKMIYCPFKFTIISDCGRFKKQNQKNGLINLEYIFTQPVALLGLLHVPSSGKGGGWA